MLAKDFNKEGKKMGFPVKVQPKLDGMRMIYDSKTGKAISRNGKSDKTQNQTKILAALSTANWHGAVLDGELYKHGLNFQQVMRGVATESLEYHVYDIVSSKPFRERSAELKSWYDSAPTSMKALVKLVPTYDANSINEIVKLQERFLAESYEGAMVRNPDSPYVHGRTPYLQKFKNFDDDEFKVVGYKPHAAGGYVFECETKSGLTFHAAPSVSVKAQTSSNPSKFIGKMLTIQYFGLSESGIPRFPQAKAFRDKSDLPSKGSPERSPEFKSPKYEKKTETKTYTEPKTPAPSDSKPRTEAKQTKEEEECKRQFSAKYTERPSPPYSANDCKGQTKLGNDGKKWTSIFSRINSSGKHIYMWVNSGTEKLYEAPKIVKEKSTVSKEKMSEGCSRQHTKKYEDRPSPPYPANECQGQIKEGNDGQLYISSGSSTGVYRWIKYNGESSSRAKESSQEKAKSPKRSPAKSPGKSECREDQIMNPATGRCVLKSGAIGKKLLAGLRGGGNYLVEIEFEYLIKKPVEEIKKMLLQHLNGLDKDDTIDWPHISRQGASLLVRTNHPGVVHYLYHSYFDQQVEGLATSIKVTPEKVNGVIYEEKFSE